MSQSFDAIIIGAGIMGCSTALQLARRGVQVAVVEKAGVGAGGTGKSSAIIRQHYSNELTARMALYSLRLFQNFAERVGGDCGFTKTGFIAVAPEKDRAGLEANVILQQGVGIQTELLSPEALGEIMPGLRTDDLVAAAYEPESGYADPYATVTAFARAARQVGVTFFLDTPVTDIRFGGNKVVGVDTPKGKIDAPLVLNCAGAWGARVAKLAGLDIPIVSSRIQVSFFRRPDAYAAPHPVVADFINATYFRPETGQLTLVGLIDPAEADAVVDPDNFSETVDSGFVLESGEGLVKRYPIMEAGHSAGGFASLYGITPDWHPIVDEAPAGSGCFICAGFSGHGFKLGPAVGVMAADMLLGESNPEFDWRLFRLNRYAENDPVRGQYEYSIAG